MKTIKIFLASSEELKDERLEMTDLVSRMNQTFKGRGIQLELKRWEYLNSSMGDQRKQDEYNNVLRECDICLVLFWRKFGNYTGEELDVAYQCYKNKKKPEIYVFFKNPDADDVTNELKEFIKSYESRYGGHFFNKFLNVDTLKLEFVLQFELYQKDLLGEKAIEVRNEHIYVDNEMVADLNNIPFAANNEGFKKKQAELKKLREEIGQLQHELEKNKLALESAKQMLESDPENPGFLMFAETAQRGVDNTTDNLQKKLDRKNALEKEFEREQQNLFNTARRITEQRGKNISQRMTRAIEAFESGDAQRADIILDEAERDFEEARKDFRITKKVSVQALEEQIQRASYKMSNDSIPIEERVSKTLEIYEEADAFAQEINYDQEKYIDFLWKYSVFLRDYAHYDKAIEICNRLIKQCEDFYGKEHPSTASSYNNIGYVSYDRGDYDKALEYHKQALDIQEKVLGKENLSTAYTYETMGHVLNRKEDYDAAEETYNKALNILMAIYNRPHYKIANNIHNLASIQQYKGNYEEAAILYNKAITMWHQTLGNLSSELVCGYKMLAFNYIDAEKWDDAWEALVSCFIRCERIYGTSHSEFTGIADSLERVWHILEEKGIATDKQRKDYEIYLSGMVIKAHIKEDGPAFQKDLRGTYDVLKYANWDITKPQSFFDEQKLMAGKEKYITFYKEGQIISEHFDGQLGIIFERMFDANLHEELAKVYNNKH